MNYQLLHFTYQQCQFILHRLDQYDLFSQVFADTPGYENLADICEDRVKELAKELDGCYSGGAYLNVDLDSELDKEILIEALEGNTYYAVCENSATSQHQLNAVAKVMHNTAKKIEEAFGLEQGSIQLMFY